MTLEEWFLSKQRPAVNPLEELQAAIRKEHTGSGMRAHLNLMRASLHFQECFCRLKKYGPEVFDPAKMPLTWKGCGKCR